MATKICKICGAEYKYCKTNAVGNAFRWQDVACCPEHGTQYFREVLESRGELNEETNKAIEAAVKVGEVVNEVIEVVPEPDITGFELDEPEEEEEEE